MASIGGAAAAGLESGFRMAQDFQTRKDRKAESDRDYELRKSALDSSMARQDKSDARQAVIDARADADYGDKVADDVHKGTVGDFSAVVAQYGSLEAVPPAVRARLEKRATEAGDMVAAAQKKRSALAFGQQAQQLDDVVTNLTTGRVQADQLPPEKLFMALAHATKRDPADFMRGPDGSPSRIATAVGDITAGLETGNEGMLLSGANTLFSPELRRGVGSESPHGGKIIGKEIIKMIPHPGNPELVSPVVRVYVDQGADFRGPRGAHNSTGYYDAPITERRSTDPDDNVKFINMKDALDRVGQMGMLTETLNHPEIRTKLEEGRATAGSQVKDHLDQYFALGAAAAPKKVLNTTAINMPANGGTTLLRTTDAQGREVKREEIKHADKQYRESNLSVKLDAIEEDETLSAEEKALQRKAVLTGIKPKAAGGGGGGSGSAGGKVTEAETKGVIKDATAVMDGKLGIVYDATRKQLMKDGKPLTPEVAAARNKGVEAIVTTVRDNAANKKKTGATDAINAATGTPKTVKWDSLK